MANDDLIREARAARDRLRELGWYRGGAGLSAEVVQLLSRLGELGEDLDPSSDEATELKVRCLLEAATRGGGDSGVVPALAALGRVAVSPLLSVVSTPHEHAFRRRAAIEALTAMSPFPVDPDAAVLPLVQVLRNPGGEDFKVLVLAIRAVGRLRARSARRALEELPRALELVALEGYQRGVIERERQAAIAAIGEGG